MMGLNSFNQDQDSRGFEVGTFRQKCLSTLHFESIPRLQQTSNILGDFFKEETPSSENLSFLVDDGSLKQSIKEAIDNDLSSVLSDGQIQTLEFNFSDYYFYYLFDKFFSLNEDELQNLYSVYEHLITENKNLQNVSFIGCETGLWPSFFYSKNFDVLGIDPSGLTLGLVRNKLNYCKRDKSLDNTFELIQNDFNQVETFVDPGPRDAIIFDIRTHILNYLSGNEESPSFENLVTSLKQSVQPGQSVVLRGIYPKNKDTIVPEILKKICTEAQERMPNLSYIDHALFLYFEQKIIEFCSKNSLHQEDVERVLKENDFTPFVSFSRGGHHLDDVVVFQRGI